MHEAGTIDSGPMIKTGLVAILLALLSVGIWFYQFQKKAMQEEVKKDLCAIARLQTERINAWHKDQLKHAALKGNPFLSDRIARFIADPSSRHRQKLFQSLGNIALQFDYSDIFLVNPNGIRLAGLTGHIRHLTGYEAILPSVLREGKQDEAFYRHLWQTILGGETWRGRMTNKRKDGSLYVDPQRPPCDHLHRVQRVD